MHTPIKTLEIVGTFQLSFVQVTHQGGISAPIEALRITKEQRLTTGEDLFEWRLHRAKERNTHFLQLTTDKKKTQAMIFYEDLGFKSTHKVIKKTLLIKTCFY
jgi:hypothetical protein